MSTYTNTTTSLLEQAYAFFAATKAEAAAAKAAAKAAAERTSGR
jgi:hypothetical protein